MWHLTAPFKTRCLSLWEWRAKQGVELSKAPAQLPFRFGWSWKCCEQQNFKNMAWAQLWSRFLVPAYCKPLGNMFFPLPLAVLEQEGLELASTKAIIKEEKVYQQEVQHLLEEQPSARFQSSQGKALASVAGNFIAKRRRQKASHFLPALPKALANNFKEGPPSPHAQSAKRPFVGS